MAKKDAEGTLEFLLAFDGHIHGALKNQVQHFWEKMLHGKNLQAAEY